MSKGTDILLSLGAEVAKSAVKWAIDKLRAKTREAGIILDDAAIEAIVTAQLTSMFTAMQVMSTAIDRDLDRLDEAERKFRSSSNVTVVDDLGDATDLQDKE